MHRPAPPRADAPADDPEFGLMDDEEDDRTFCWRMDDHRHGLRHMGRRTTTFLSRYPRGTPGGTSKKKSEGGRGKKTWKVEVELSNKNSFSVLIHHLGPDLRVKFQIKLSLLCKAASWTSGY